MKKKSYRIIIIISLLVPLLFLSKDFRTYISFALRFENSYNVDLVELPKLK